MTPNPVKEEPLGRCLFGYRGALDRMASTVQWKLMFRVANRVAFDKCLARTLPLLGAGCEVREGRPYWKIPEL